MSECPSHVSHSPSAPLRPGPGAGIKGKRMHGTSFFPQVLASNNCEPLKKVIFSFLLSVCRMGERVYVIGGVAHSVRKSRARGWQRK